MSTGPAVRYDMSYDLMLLAEPGPDRGEVLRVLTEAPDIRPDPEVGHRFWLRTEHGEARINIGTKDPVESVHVEFGRDDLPLMEASARRALELADLLGMRVEDVQWGSEVTREALPELRRYWESLAAGPPALGVESAPRRPWWRFW